jgi:hypothetical protein
MKYLENGHITLPHNQLGKPPGAGKVYVFGTHQPHQDERLTEVLQWTSDGRGGDGRGRLLTVQHFDDKRCYQINDGSMSTNRQKEFPNPESCEPGLCHEQWCETDVAIPEDASVGSQYSIYWVWDWPTKPGVAGLPLGKDEFYTSCSDVEVVDELRDVASHNPLAGQDPQTSAVSNYSTRALHHGF